MSFSSEVKEELSKQFSKSRHCEIAELTAIVNFCGQAKKTTCGGYHVVIQTENLTVARKCFTLLEKTFNIKAEITVKRNAFLKKSRTYIVSINHSKDGLRLLQALKLVDYQGVYGGMEQCVSNLIIQSNCCKRAFLRGAFLSIGSISDPEKFYHLELATTKEDKAEQIKELMKQLDLDAKIVTRKKYFVVYIKEGNQIVDCLNLMEAHVSLMNFENIRILKDMRNSINRKVNCETANIQKTVSAATKQLDDIKFIRDTIGFSNLPDGLEEIALARLKDPEATLKELGEALDPPVGKSGVNHRLRKLKIIAEQIREEQGGEL